MISWTYFVGLMSTIRAGVEKVVNVLYQIVSLSPWYIKDLLGVAVVFTFIGILFKFMRD